jgi:hypothetical protein
VTGPAPDVELRIIERLTLRVVAAETTERRIHLDRAFEQYLETPRELGEIVGRWASVIVGWTVQQDYRKAQYAVSPHLFQQQGRIFELVDDGKDDESHAIPSPSNLDIHAIKRGGGSDLVIVIATPLGADTRSVYRLFQKIDNYLQFIAGDAYKKECGTPSKESTRIIVRAHEETDPAPLELLSSVGDWVTSRNASLVVEGLDVIH